MRRFGLRQLQLSSDRSFVTSIVVYFLFRAVRWLLPCVAMSSEPSRNLYRPIYKVEAVVTNPPFSVNTPSSWPRLPATGFKPAKKTAGRRIASALDGLQKRHGAEPIRTPKTASSEIARFVNSFLFPIAKRRQCLIASCIATPCRLEKESSKFQLRVAPAGDGYCLPSYHQSPNIGVKPEVCYSQ